MRRRLGVPLVWDVEIYMYAKRGATDGRSRAWRRNDSMSTNPAFGQSVPRTDDTAARVYGKARTIPAQGLESKTLRAARGVQKPRNHSARQNRVRTEKRWLSM